MQRMSVDLPHPDGPTIVTSSPLATWKVMFSMAE
jgi:hypothetical protein